MKILAITSNRERHRFLCRQIAQEHELVGIISEDKGLYYSEQVSNSKLIQQHFQALKSSEIDTFGEGPFPSVPLLEMSKSRINDEVTLNWARSCQPDAVILFGTGILHTSWLTAFRNRIINIHLGYSPYYRGSATLFWPFYNEDLEHLGVTVHLAAEKVDAGKILKIIRPQTLHGDYYDITNGLIKDALCAVSSITRLYCSGQLVPVSQDLSVGKVYRKSDFSEESLKTVLQVRWRI